MNNNFVLYLHIAPNGKKYFGITGQNPKRRWKYGRGYEGQTFYKAVKKYGWNNIGHYILADDLTKEEACFFEQVMIALYDTTNRNNGYNETTGGEYFNHTEETKQKISESNKGENHPMYGKHRTEETKQKISESLKGENSTWHGKTGIKHNSSKSVICITTKQIFGSAREAQRKTNAHCSNISKCCKGDKKYKYAGKTLNGTKMVWRYINHKHNKTYHIVGGYFVDNEKITRLIEESFGPALSDEEIALLIEDVFGTDESIDYDNLSDII